MKIIQLQEQMLEKTILQQDVDAILQHVEDGKEVAYSAKRGSKQQLCLKLQRKGSDIYATSSYYVGIDWIIEKELAVQVNPKLNKSVEIDYLKMLNEALTEPENYEHLKDLVTIYFDKPSIRVKQQEDILSVFLITEFLNLLQRVVKKGLKKNFYIVEENIQNKVKGRVLVGKNIHQNLMKGRIVDNVCRFQVYDVDCLENRILKKALKFCIRQLGVYKNAIDVGLLENKIRFIKPFFKNVREEVSVNTIQTFKGNPIFKEYNQVVIFAQLLLRRYSYDISKIAKKEVYTPPFWIDMSKLFELYVFHHLRRIFTAKNEIKYHVKVFYQELDYLLRPLEWQEPYVIDAKYKPRYKDTGGITIDDARQISGYSRLNSIYQRLGLDENKALPVKCLIIYPDQEQKERFEFTRKKEPVFEKVNGYVRVYKIGIKLPEIIQD